MSIEPGRDTPPPYIRYSSSGYAGQAVQRRTPRLAYQAVLDLLNSCTDWPSDWPGGQLRVLEAGSYMETHYDAEVAFADFTRMLGAPKPAWFFAAQGSERGQGCYEFPYTGSQQIAVVERVLSEPHVPTKGLFAMCVMCAVKARLRDPRTGAPLTRVEHDPEGLLPPSYFGLEVSPSGVRLDLGLVFPFASPNEAFLDALRAIRPYLPVRLGKASFAHVQPLNAKKERRHKLSVGLFDGI
jgi:hypothetical protein